MTSPVLTEAARDKSLTPLDLKLIIVLANAGAEEGFAVVSQAQTANELGYSRRSVCRSVARLIASGYIEIESRFDGGVRLASQYRLGIPDRDAAPREKNYRKTKITDALRWAVLHRDDFRCRSCGARRYLTVDHIEPERHGGDASPDNLQTLCRSCNSHKWSKPSGDGTQGT